jgi:hypothetical protein
MGVWFPKLFFFISEEIARQLENSGTKYVMTIGLFLQNIKQVNWRQENLANDF